MGGQIFIYTYLKGTLAWDFLLLFFFPSKAPTWSPDSYPKFVYNIKVNLPRYSNYSSLCVDSVNAELIFCCKLYKNCYHFLVDIGPIFVHFIVSFSKSYPFKRRQSWLCIPVLAWFISLTLSQRGVRLFINWVNAEWDSTSTESTQS